MIIVYSTTAFCIGFALDLIFGDPRELPHIVRIFGRLISALEQLLRREGHERAGGLCLVVITLLLCTGIPFVVLFWAYRLSPSAGIMIEGLLCYQLLAVKSLRDESMNVAESLLNNDMDSARKKLSMIVGRDTDRLDKDAATRAAIETVAENASDGCIAPMFFIMLGGGTLGCFYKAVNTMDSMLGYKNEKYIDFGRAAAKLDDFVNYIPSRLSAWLMIAGAKLTGMDSKSAYRVWRRDHGNHASPNSAQTEAVCAGALGIRLGGASYYSGVLCDKPTIGDDTRPVEVIDISKANKLLYATVILMLALFLLVRGFLFAAI